LSDEKAVLLLRVTRHPGCFSVYGHDLSTLALCSGSGQAAAELAKRYDKVVGMDASEAQLSQAPIAPNIVYKCAPAEETGLPDHCADLVTVAQALHW
jgi:ubiquinone/menaquinone biosynthesis C-methylase UbiE